MSMEFVPGNRPPGPDCTDRAAWGSPSVIIPQYIAKIKVENEDDYPKAHVLLIIIPMQLLTICWSLILLEHLV